MANKIMKYAWLALAISIAILMPIYGAWHHLATLGISLLMYGAFRSEETEAEAATAPDDTTA